MMVSCSVPFKNSNKMNGILGTGPRTYNRVVRKEQFKGDDLFAIERKGTYMTTTRRWTEYDLEGRKVGGRVTLNEQLEDDIG